MSTLSFHWSCCISAPLKMLAIFSHCYSSKDTGNISTSSFHWKYWQPFHIVILVKLMETLPHYRFRGDTGNIPISHCHSIEDTGNMSILSFQWRCWQHFQIVISLKILVTFPSCHSSRDTGNIFILSFEWRYWQHFKIHLSGDRGNISTLSLHAFLCCQSIKNIGSVSTLSVH